LRFHQKATKVLRIPLSAPLRSPVQIESGHGNATVHVGATGFLGLIEYPSDNRSFSGGGAPTVTGVDIETVVPGSPAQEAGIAANDVVTAFDGHAVSTPGQLEHLMVAHSPGNKVTVTWVGTTVSRTRPQLRLVSGPALVTRARRPANEPLTRSAARRTSGPDTSCSQTRTTSQPGPGKELSGLLVPAAVAGDSCRASTSRCGVACGGRALGTRARSSHRRKPPHGQGRTQCRLCAGGPARVPGEGGNEAQSMQRAAKDKFGRCALAALDAHAPANCVARGERFAPTFGQSDRP